MIDEGRWQIICRSKNPVIAKRHAEAYTSSLENSIHYKGRVLPWGYWIIYDWDGLRRRDRSWSLEEALIKLKSTGRYDVDYEYELRRVG